MPNNASAKKHKLCSLDQLTESGGREFSVAGKSYVVIQHEQQLFAYTNVCPHIGTPLNWMPDRFLDRDKQFILCASHGARFEIDTGLCIAGPCQGRHLEAVPLSIEQGSVYLHI